MGGMKVKTSVTLSSETLSELDRQAGARGRSAVIEEALKEHFHRIRREERSHSEREALQRLLSSPDFESDVLEYGVGPQELGDDASLITEERANSRQQAS